MTEERKPFGLRDSFRDYELAVTKEQHDRFVEQTGRPFTDDPIGRRYNGRNRHVPTESASGDNARRYREDGST